MGKITNQFGAGMDQDSSKNKYDNTHYFEANNVRILTQDGSTSGALEDMDGTLERLDLDGDGKVVFIVGYCILRDNIIIFVTENPNLAPDPITYTDYILRVPIADLEALTGTDVLLISYDTYWGKGGGNLIYEGNMGFSTQNPILAVGRYETSYIQKVYWVDDYNKFRYINIVNNNDTNDLDNLPVDRLEVLGNFDLTQPTIIDVVGGNLRSGRIQYAYQLYSLYGAETVFSPTSVLFNLTEYDEYGPAASYKGSELDVDTGKGLQCTIDVDSLYYTRIRVVAIHWTTLFGDPSIRIVREDDIDPAGGIYIFTDSGESLGSYTLEEIRLLETTLFSAAVLETKDNILFAGNVEVDDFDVEYDARAYRFGGASSTSTEHNYNEKSYIRRMSRAFEVGIDYYLIDGTVATPTVTYEPAGTPVGDWTDIPEDADCINGFNDLDNDGLHDWRFMYQTDGATVGGEGPNVKYKFEVLGRSLDEGGVNFYSIYPGNSPSYPSYSSYLSPWESGYHLGYHRDEIYRFGVVFFDEKGRSSFVKWIGDIRMPSISTRYGALSYENYRTLRDQGLGEIEARILYPEFTIDNMPSEAVSYQIVRVRRESNDRTVLAQGVAMEAHESLADEAWHLGWKETNPGSDLFQFVSPEVAFNKNLSMRSTDEVQVVGTWGNNVDFVDADTLDRTKYEFVDVLANSQTPWASPGVLGNEFYRWNKRETNESSMLLQTDGSITIAGLVYYVNNSTNITDKGICFLYELTGNWAARGIDYDDGIKLLNIRRNLVAVQYGGNDYNARSANEYIVCSDVYDKATYEGVAVDVFGGDTYIGMFDYLWNAHQNGVALGTPQANAIMFGCETSVNIAIRLDDPYWKQQGNKNAQMIRDNAGIYADDDIATGSPTLIYLQEMDQYRYNTVYSKENTAILHTPQPFDWRASTKIDVRVYASDMKINGELSDSWLKFRTDSFIEVDPQYGPLTVLQTMTDKLTFFQPQAFGTLSVNERALLQTVDVAQLSLGVSGVLERFDYAKTNVGCSHWRHLILTPNALYWMDAINQSMFQYTKGPEEISMMRGMNSWFRENIVERGDADFTTAIDGSMHLFYDPEYREVYVVDNTVQFGLIYNEMTGSFTTFTDNQPFYAINYLEKVIGTSGAFNNFHRHNDWNASRGHIYGNYREISLTLLINPSVEDIGIFNNFEWLTECFNDNIVFGLQDQPITWDSVTMYNDYQHTGVISLTVGDNVKRRMRKWRFTIPRARYARNGWSALPTGDSRYSRMRDTHLFAKFAYTNTESTRKFTMHDITTSVTISNT